MVLPEPRSFDGGPPTAGAWPSLGAAARLLLGLLRGALLGWWWSDLWAGSWLTLRPRRGPWLRPRRGPWLGRCSDHRRGCSWLVLGPLRGRWTAPGSERGQKKLEAGAKALLCCRREAGGSWRQGGRPCSPSHLQAASSTFQWQHLPGSPWSGD